MIQLQTKNITPWINTCEYIVTHHTWTWEWTIKGVLNTLTKGAVSCHYIIDTTGDVYKIGEDKDILWHAWVSEWKWKKDLNKYSIWIEIVWPLPNWFTDKQRATHKTLIKELCKTHWIPKENCIRHKDIAPKRKTDIADSFWNWISKTWNDYINTLFITIMANRYKDIMNKELAESKLPNLFDNYDEDFNLTDWEIKSLIMIALIRLNKKLKG